MQLLTWVNEGVRDFSISRSAVQWGINIPNDPAQTVYVWFDALLGRFAPQAMLQIQVQVLVAW